MYAVEMDGRARRLKARTQALHERLDSCITARRRFADVGAMGGS